MKHPIHPLVVHFPIACWSLSTIGDLINPLLMGRLNQAIGLLLLVGCISGMFSIAAGIYEAGKIKARAQLDHIVDKHIYAATSAWCLYFLSLLLRWDGNAFTAATLWAVMTSVSGFVSLVAAGWYGASLVYIHGVGQHPPSSRN